jgi:hypothetical protein
MRFVQAGSFEHLKRVVCWLESHQTLCWEEAYERCGACSEDHAGLRKIRSGHFNMDFPSDKMCCTLRQVGLKGKILWMMLRTVEGQSHIGAVGIGKRRVVMQGGREKKTVFLQSEEYRIFVGTVCANTCDCTMKLRENTEKSNLMPTLRRVHTGPRQYCQSGCKVGCMAALVRTAPGSVWST